MVELLYHRLYGPQSQIYLLHGPLLKTFDHPWTFKFRKDNCLSWILDNHLSDTPRSVYRLYDSHLRPPGSSSFTPSRDLFRTSQDRRGHGRIWLSRGHRLFCSLCLSGHVPVRVQGSPKGEDYLSFVHVALQKPLDINVSWLASVRPGLEHSAVRVFVFVELS